MPSSTSNLQPGSAECVAICFFAPIGKKPEYYWKHWRPVMLVDKSFAPRDSPKPVICFWPYHPLPLVMGSLWYQIFTLSLDIASGIRGEVFCFFFTWTRLYQVHTMCEFMNVHGTDCHHESFMAAFTTNCDGNCHDAAMGPPWPRRWRWTVLRCHGVLCFVIGVPSSSILCH